MNGRNKERCRRGRLKRKPKIGEDQIKREWRQAPTEVRWGERARKTCSDFAEYFRKKYIIGIDSIQTEAKLTRHLLYCFLLCKAKLVAVSCVARNQITQLWHSYLISADRNTSHRNVCLLTSSRWNNSVRELCADKLAGLVFPRTGAAIMTTSSRARENGTFTSNNHRETPMPASPTSPPPQTHTPCSRPDIPVCTTRMFKWH
jgi:hypothetical protein